MKRSLKDVSGTTMALTSLAIMGAAAVVSAPVWMWYRRKRKRTDSMAGTPPAFPVRRELPSAEEPTGEPVPEQPDPESTARD